MPFGFWVYLPVGEEVGEEDQTLRLPPVGSSWAGSTLPEAPPLQVLTPLTLWLPHSLLPPAQGELLALFFHPL